MLWSFDDLRGAFFVFGLRSEDSYGHVEYLPIFQQLVVCCWGVAFCAQAMHLRREHMRTEAAADNVLAKVFGRKRMTQAEIGASSMNFSAFRLGRRMSSFGHTKLGKIGKDSAITDFIAAKDTGKKWKSAVKFAHQKAKIDKVLRVDAVIREEKVKVEQEYANPFLNRLLLLENARAIVARGP